MRGRAASVLGPRLSERVSDCDCFCVLVLIHAGLFIDSFHVIFLDCLTVHLIHVVAAVRFVRASAVDH